MFGDSREFQLCMPSCSGLGVTSCCSGPAQPGATHASLDGPAEIPHASQCHHSARSGGPDTDPLCEAQDQGAVLQDRCSERPEAW